MEINLSNVDEDKLKLAYMQYCKNLNRVKQYNKENPDKCKIRQNRYYHKLKEENPDKHIEMLKRKKEYYQNKKAMQINKKSNETL